MSDYYQVLGVPRTAKTDEIRQAYLRLARERHPDRFPEGPERQQAHELFQHATAAFNTLMNERARREYDQEMQRPRAVGPEEMARVACENGFHCLENKQYHEAVELFRAAVTHAPGMARAHAGLATALARNPHWVREAVHEAEEAARLEPRVAAWHALLADLFLSQGMRLRAHRAAETALALDPGDARAQRVFDESGPTEPPPEEGGGLLGRLRRR
jgi:curved DNA-binding protein CbpA